MPVLPSEENAPSSITEKIAKEPSSNTDFTASEHEHHRNEHTPGKASAQDFQSKGPAIPTNMSGMLDQCYSLEYLADMIQICHPRQVRRS